MKIKFLLPLVAALTFALTACDDDKKGSDMYNPDSGNLPSDQNPGDKLDMNGPGAAGGIDENQRIAGLDPDKDVDYSTLATDTIYFEFDKSTIPPQERGKLAAVKQWLDSNPGHRLFLAGHADKRGTPEYNRALGERRALAVREYLAGLGAPAGNLFTISYGSDKPAVDGDTEEAYAKNRRVEVGVINKQ